MVWSDEDWWMLEIRLFVAVVLAGRIRMTIASQGFRLLRCNSLDPRRSLTITIVPQTKYRHYAVQVSKQRPFIIHSLPTSARPGQAQ
jgi:hypothetical protein